MRIMKKSTRKHVHILIGWQNPRIIDGFCKYAHEANWHLDTLSFMTGILPGKRRGDGVLMTNAHTPEMKRMMLEVAASNIPCVLHGPNELGIDIPTSETDEAMIGRLAALHLLERGHKNFAVLARGNSEHARRRFEGFSSTVKEKGYAVHFLRSRSMRLDSLADWLMAELATLPRPLALFAVDDILASEAIEAAYESGWRVPEDVSVVGVGNLQIVCQYSRIPITSVSMPTEEQAYQAARMLDDLMNDRKLVKRHHVLPPTEVITRTSSDYLAITHPQVRKSVDCIKLNAMNPDLSLSTIAETAGTSLSNLYNLFRKELHATPAEIVQRFRLEESLHLILSSSQKIERVATACGFGSLRTFQRCFHKKYGLYPSQFRSIKAQHAFSRDAAPKGHREIPDQSIRG